MLVGMDILAPEKVKFDLGRGRMEITRGGEDFSIGCSIRRIHPSTRLEILACEQAVVPPGQTRAVRADVSRLDPLALYGLHPVSHGSPGWGVPAVVSRHEPRVRIGNRRHTAVTVVAGTVLGLARPLPRALAAQTPYHQVFEPTYDYPLPEGIVLHDRSISDYQDVNINPELNEGQRNLLLLLPVRHCGLFTDQLGCARMRSEEWMRIPITPDQELKFGTPQPYRSSRRSRD